MRPNIRAQVINRPKIRSVSLKPSTDQNAMVSTKAPRANKNGVVQVFNGGAPAGNTNATNGRLWNAAILQALEERAAAFKKRGKANKMEALVQVAHKLIGLSLSGSVPAIKELGDRIDGKAAQPIVGDPNKPVEVQHTNIFLTHDARVTRLLQLLALREAEPGQVIPGQVLHKERK